MNKIYIKMFTKYLKNITLNIFFLIGISILSIAGPLLLRDAIDYNIATGITENKILVYIVVITILYVLKFMYNRYRFWFQKKFKDGETTELYKKIFLMQYEKINKLEPTYLTERVSSTINTIFNLYSSSLSGIFISALTMFLILYVITKINWVLALLYFIQIPLQYWGFQRLLNGSNSKLSQYGILLQEISAKNNKNIKAIMSDVNSIKQYNGEKGIISFIERCVCDTNRIEKEGNVYAMDMCTILEYFCQIIKNVSYILIVYLYINGDATVGDMVYLNLMNDIYYGSVGDAINIQVNLRDLKGAMKFIVDEIEANYEEDGNIEIEKVNHISGKIKKIGYENNTLIEEGEFQFKKGDIIALEGASGTGKSTFVKLLNKYIKSEGIYINNIDINRISNRELRNRVFYLAQSTYLLPFSIKENLTLGEGVDKTRWEKLLQMDFMKKFISMEKGIDTIVYENGTNLSGGDKQKIVLGRIFLKNPDVIILDESFSAIDEKTGEEIINRIVEMYSDRIIIIISHSNKYLKKCNKRVQIIEKKLVQEDIVKYEVIYQ